MSLPNPTTEQFFTSINAPLPDELAGDEIEIATIDRCIPGYFHLLVKGHPSGDLSIWRVDLQDGTTQFLGNAKLIDRSAA